MVHLHMSCTPWSSCMVYARHSRLQAGTLASMVSLLRCTAQPAFASSWQSLLPPLNSWHGRAQESIVSHHLSHSSMGEQSTCFCAQAALEAEKQAGISTQAALKGAQSSAAAAQQQCRAAQARCTRAEAQVQHRDAQLEEMQGELQGLEQQVRPAGST